MFVKVFESAKNVFYLSGRTNVAADSESRLVNTRRTFLAAELGVRSFNGPQQVLIKRKEMRIIITIVFLISLIVSAKIGYAKIGSVGIKDLIRHSEYIMIGRCQSITEIEGVKVAKVEVIKTIKGKETNELYYLAESQWTCDISGAVIGETALYFFDVYQYNPNPKAREVLPEGQLRIRGNFQEPLGFKQIVELLSDQIPFLQIAYAGRGKMPVSTVDGLDYVTLYVEDVILPKNIKTIPGTEKQYSDFIRSVQLREILLLIEQQLNNHNSYTN